MTDSPAPVCVSRKIDVPAEKLFAVLAQAANHPRIDGSGMVRESLDGVVISGVGDVFTMKMHNDEMGDYEMSNHVVEYEPSRRISKAVKGGTRWLASMTITLEKLDALSRG